MAGTLHLQVIAGLCSRLRAVVGASAYCEATGKSLVVHWPLLERFERRGEVPFPAAISDLWLHPYSEDNKSTGRFPKQQQRLSESGDVYLRTASFDPFLPYMRCPVGSYLRPFRPVPEVVAMAHPFLVAMDGLTVGVSIRWKLCKKLNRCREPLEWWVDRLSRIMEQRSGVKFYLATDCKEADDRIHKAFPGRVTALKHGTDYAYDYDGIRRSLADLHILAATNWLVGSRRSSYCQMVAFMRGAERIGSIMKPCSTRGGRYEAPGSPAPEGDMLRALAAT